MIHTPERINIKTLHENPKNIRKHFDEEFIEKLADSLKRYGFISPIVALRDGMVVAGNQRYRAAKKAGIKELTVGKDIIFIEKDTTTEKDVDTINAIENIMRRQLNVFEEAEGLYRILKDHMGLTDGVKAFNLAIQTYQAYLKDDLRNNQQKELVEICGSLGIGLSRAYMLLSVYKLSPATLKYLRHRILNQEDTTLPLAKIYNIALIQRKHQLLVAKGVVKLKISSGSVRRVYNQWLQGLRHDDLRYKGSARAQAELEAAEAAIKRRDRVIKQVEDQPTTKSVFSFAALSTDLKMLRYDLDVAFKALDSSLAMPRSELAVLETLTGTVDGVVSDLAKLKELAQKRLSTTEAVLQESDS